MADPRTILALDTSTDACVVALQHDGRIWESFRVIPRQHNRQLLPMVNDLLHEAHLSPQELDLLVFGRGPGSFTGIRIATGVTQGLAFGLMLRVVPVSTLASLAQGRHRTSGDGLIAVAMQARQEEIYWGCFEVSDGVVTQVGDERLIHCSEARLPREGDWVGIGSGWQHRTLLEAATARTVSSVDEEVHPRGADLLTLGLRDHQLGLSVAAADAKPVYLREQVAQTAVDTRSD